MHVFNILNLLSLAVAAGRSAYSSELTVRTTYGPVQGQYSPSSSSVREFLGIPYAAPPTGSLRFMPPKAPSPWTSPRAAKTFGPTCFQTLPKVELGDLPIIVPTPPSEGEDCLSINVFTPIKSKVSGNGSAVMLWIYGGGFMTGGSFSYNGTNIVRDQNVVVVTFNYRLNVFGFPGVEGDGLAAQQKNPGLLDIRFAVEWTRDNIAAFGGDPKKITLFGQSAGGMATDAYMHFAESDPIVRAGILQSGAADNFIFSRASTWANLTAVLNCGSGSSADQVCCMRAVPAADLRAAIVSNNLVFIPIADEGTIFSNYAARLESGKYAKVPMLIGSTDEEVPTPGSSEGAELSRELFICPAARAARSHAKYVNTWQYRYFGSYPIPGIEISGAFHGSEIGQVFGTYNTTSATAQQKKSSKYIQGAWAAFAKDPEHGLKNYSPGWPTYNKSSASLVRLSYDNQPGATFASPSLYEADCSF